MKGSNTLADRLYSVGAESHKGGRGGIRVFGTVVVVRNDVEREREGREKLWEKEKEKQAQTYHSQARIPVVITPSITTVASTSVGDFRQRAQSWCACTRQQLKGTKTSQCSTKQKEESRWAEG